MSLDAIKYVSYGQQVGYAIASVNYLEHLVSALPVLSWETIIQDDHLKYGFDPAFYDDLPASLRRLLEFSRDGDSKKQILHTTPEHFPALVKDGQQNIGMTVWETNKLPVNWKKYFDRIDKIIVPCTWNVNVFEEAGLGKPIYKLPHIAQFLGENDDTNFLNIPDDTFVFLNISVWERRKNLEQLVNAYFKAFSRHDNVVLIIKTSKRDMSAPFHTIGGKKRYLKTKNRVRILDMKNGFRNARIILIPHSLSTAEIKSLYTRANAYVSLSHAEGWGMGIYESAWYGKPVIATNYSGYLDFLTPENAYLVDAHLVDVVANDWEKNDLKGHKWAQPDMESAVAQMRRAFSDKLESSRKGDLLKAHVSENFSAAGITSDFIKIINA